jgi:glycosyltransferase involved in cell wall biosynthesis
MSQTGEPKPMRILRVAQVERNRTGGMSRTMFLTGDELERLGHSVDYWFLEDLPVAVPPQLWRFATPWKLRRKLAAERHAGREWDIVEVHEPLGALLTVFRTGRSRLVALSYGLEERSRLASLDYRTRAGIPISLKERYSPLTVVWQSMWTTHHVDHVLCSNPTDIAHLVSKGLDPLRLTRHFSGVERAFLEAQPPPCDQRRGILFVGNWIQRKGIRELVPAVTELLRRHPDLTFTAAGTILPDEVVLGAFDPSVRGRIRVVRRLEGTKALIELYGSHAVLVLPSYFEGHPLVLVEAAAQGLPVVGTQIGGIGDFLTDGEDGFLVPVADPVRLGKALGTLVEQPELRARFGVALRRKAAAFTWEAAARNIEGAYRKALAMPRRG